MSEAAMTRTGYVLSGLFVLFMLGASVTPKLLGLPLAEETLAALGYAVPIGILELVLTLLYLHPPLNEIFPNTINKLEEFTWARQLPFSSHA